MPLIPCFAGLGLGIFPLRIRCRIRKAIGMSTEPTCAAAMQSAAASDPLLGTYRIAR